MGEIFTTNSGRELKLEVNPKFHVRGATKIYRRACWEAIGGLWRAPGWDTIDEVKANMLGWKTYSFEELHLIHHRFTGSADGLVRDCVKHGVVCYICGYHPLFVVASCFYRLIRKPYIVGSFAIALWISERLFYRHAAGKRLKTDQLFTCAATEAPVRVGDHLEVTFIPAEPQRTGYVWNLRKA